MRERPMHRMRTGPTITKSMGVSQANKLSDMTMIPVINMAYVTT